MFLHNFKYELLSSLRVKDVVIWLILFPIALGTCFKVAFSSVYDNTMVFETIDVAVVEDTDEMQAQMFRQIIKDVKMDDQPMFKVKYTTKEKALKMLEDEKVSAVIFEGEELKMTTASNGLKATIVQSFLNQYTHNADLIMSAMLSDQSDTVQEVTETLSAEVKSINKKALTHGNTDLYIQYFYNLIAMVALYGSLSGLHIAIANQANLSPLGARKNISPTPKLISISAALCGTFILELICTAIAVTYTRFVLNVDYGDRLGFVYLAAFIGGCLGVSLGFMVGSFGRMSQNAKSALCSGVSLGLCFFSGLMDGGMKAKVAQDAPWFNYVNPAALISDSVYCLNVYEDMSRYWEKIISMIVITAVFTLVGFMLTRRRKYASV